MTSVTFGAAGGWGRPVAWRRERFLLPGKGVGPSWLRGSAPRRVRVPGRFPDRALSPGNFAVEVTLTPEQ